MVRFHISAHFSHFQPCQCSIDGGIFGRRVKLTYVNGDATVDHPSVYVCHRPFCFSHVTERSDNTETDGQSVEDKAGKAMD